MGKQYYIYILTNMGNNVLYTGVTNDLKRRIYEHKEKLIDGFTKKYNIDRLVYCEFTGNVSSAIKREKQIKSGSRKKKVELIKRDNPCWDDLYDSI
jgi:putative endonuclease